MSKQIMPHSAEDFVDCLIKLIGMDEYKRRGYDKIEAEAQEAIASNDENEKEIVTGINHQRRKVIYRRLLFKKTDHTSNSIEQEAYLQSFFEWIQADKKNDIEKKKLLSNTGYQPHKDEIKNISVIIPAQIKSSENKNNDKENNTIKVKSLENKDSAYEKKRQHQ